MDGTYYITFASPLRVNRSIIKPTIKKSNEAEDDAMTISGDKNMSVHNILFINRLY